MASVRATDNVEGYLELSYRPICFVSDATQELEKSRLLLHYATACATFVMLQPVMSHLLVGRRLSFHPKRVETSRDSVRSFLG